MRTGATAANSSNPNCLRLSVKNTPATAATSTIAINGAVGNSGAVSRKSPTGQIPASWKPLSGWNRLPIPCWGAALSPEMKR